MQVEIDFEVYKALTLLRESEDDSYSDVIARLLTLSKVEVADGDLYDKLRPAKDDLFAALWKGPSTPDSGAWIGNVHFPNGTRFRATYKGRTYHAQIKDDVWIGEDGIVRRSPSEAASAISDTNVNGWRFWFGIRPSEDEWKRLDEFRT